MEEKRERKIVVGILKPRALYKDTIYVSPGYHEGRFNAEAESNEEFAYLEPRPGYERKSLVTRVSSIQAACRDLGSFLDMLREQNTSEGQRISIDSKFQEDADEMNIQIGDYFG